MNKKINLKQVEIKVFTTTFKDGLLDISLAIIFSQFSLAPLLSDIGYSDFEASAVFIPVYLIAFLILYLLKKYVTQPRTGIAKPGPARKTKLIKVNIFLLIILFCGFFAGLFFPDFFSVTKIIFPITFSILLLAVFSVSAFYLNLARLYYYGIALAMAPIAGEILWQNGLTSHHGYPLVFGSISLFFLISGIVYFVRFLHENPVPLTEKNNVG